MASIRKIMPHITPAKLSRLGAEKKTKHSSYTRKTKFTVQYR